MAHGSWGKCTLHTRLRTSAPASGRSAFGVLLQAILMILGSVRPELWTIGRRDH